MWIMDSFYKEEELLSLGLKQYGSDVHISRKASIYGAENVIIGDNVRIDDFCILSGRVEIGNNVHIAAYSALYGGTEGIFIGNFANISSRVSIYSVSNDYSGKSMTNPTIPDEYKEVIKSSVHIGEDVIIGSTSVVLPGVNIAEGGSFGAFSLINQDTEEWTIYAGIPVKKLKERSRRAKMMEKEYIAKQTFGGAKLKRKNFLMHSFCDMRRNVA